MDKAPAVLSLHPMFAANFKLIANLIWFSMMYFVENWELCCFERYHDKVVLQSKICEVFARMICDHLGRISCIS